MKTDEAMEWLDHLLDGNSVDSLTAYDSGACRERIEKAVRLLAAFEDQNLQNLAAKEAYYEWDAHIESAALGIKCYRERLHPDMEGSDNE